MSELSELLTVDELASRIKIKAETIRSWARSGRIPCRKLGYKVTRYVLGDVLKALESESHRTEGVDR